MNDPSQRDTIRVDTVDGPMWVFAADAYVSRSLALYGEYAAAEVDVFRQIVRPGTTVVEAGANLGSHSVFLARQCAPGPFFAFEPQQRVFQVLCANLTINNVTNARAYPDALGDAPGLAEIATPDYASPGNFGAAALVTPQIASSAALAVRVRTLDEFQLPACHFLKIDVEGSELSVLRGADETIKRHRPFLYVENDRAAHQKALIAHIHALGYRQYWHVAMLFRAQNFNRVAENVFGQVAALNMLCIPKESQIEVSAFEEIDPANWRSPMPPMEPPPN